MSLFKDKTILRIGIIIQQVPNGYIGEISSLATVC